MFIGFVIDGELLIRKHPKKHQNYLKKSFQNVTNQSLITVLSSFEDIIVQLANPTAKPVNYKKFVNDINHNKSLQTNVKQSRLQIFYQ